MSNYKKPKVSLIEKCSTARGIQSERKKTLLNFYKCKFPIEKKKHEIAEKDETINYQSTFDFKTKKALLIIWNKDYKIRILDIGVYYTPSPARFPQRKCDIEEVFVFLHDKYKNPKYYNINLDFRHALEDVFTVYITYDLKYLKGNIHYKVDEYSYHKFDIPFFSSCTKLKNETETQFHKANESIENLSNFEFKEHVLLSNRDNILLHELMTYYNMAPKMRESCLLFVMLRYALDIETCSTLKDMEMKDVQLKMNISHGIDIFKTCSFKTDTVFKDDEWKLYAICLIPMNSFKKLSYKSKNKSYYEIKNYKNGRIYFDLKDLVDAKKLYHISFLSYSTAYQASVNALNSIKSLGLEKYFLEFEVAPVKCSKIYRNHRKIDIFKWLDKRVATNKEQMMAIKNIVNCTAYPFPFIIFGPPGTGKTSTLIECVAQILQHKPQSRILITAQSNSACDEIGVRLIKAIDFKKVFRLYSNSQLENQQSTEIRRKLFQISNLRNGRRNEVTYEQVYHFNVIITTLMKSNQLIKAELKMEHFDYIFVDECASAAETECLVPILGTRSNKITTNLVFLGDHKQLGPVINSKFAEKLGLGVSLMERMMTKRRYNKCPSYNNNYIIQLLDNYRNHPAILHFPNKQFYDSKLRAKALQKPGGKFPIIFHSTKKPSKIELNGTSSYNDTEVKIVKSYVDNLLRKGLHQLDIGIISPYKAQLTKLRTILGKLTDIEIGTAEYYQGREKNVIIISTVKSHSSVGFLKSEKV
ncbi:unnamed protein product [Diamesa tonsa]